MEPVSAGAIERDAQAAVGRHAPQETACSSVPCLLCHGHPADRRGLSGQALLVLPFLFVLLRMAHDYATIQILILGCFSLPWSFGSEGMLGIS